jgi:hypothetical protein
VLDVFVGGFFEIGVTGGVLSPPELRRISGGFRSAITIQSSLICFDRRVG